MTVTGAEPAERPDGAGAEPAERPDGAGAEPAERPDGALAGQFRLSGAWNFRDLGGLRTSEGAEVAPGLVFRSSNLAGLDADGRRSLIELGVTDVFDLRSEREIEREGADKLPDGVRLNVRPFHPPETDAERDAEADKLPPHETAPQRTHEDARRYMEDAYRKIPTLDGARVAISDAAQRIVDGDGAILFHCAAGKDRAGWTAITLLKAIGVTEDDVLADYLRSNEAIEPLRASLMARYGDEFDLSDEILGVSEDYYAIGMRTVEDAYGDFTRYLDAIGLDTTMRARLRDRLLR